MIKWICLWVICLTVTGIYSQGLQDTLKGYVSYKTSQNIYVKFENTKDITVGDTLYGVAAGMWLPIMVVHQLSTTSCVGSPVNSAEINLSDTVFSLHEKQNEPEAPPTPPSPLYEAIVTPKEPQSTGQATLSTTPKTKPLPAFRGRISAASYINFANQPGYDIQRMRYTFTLNSREPAEKGFAVETYMTFRHTIDQWQEVKDDFKKAMKIYSLAVLYKANTSTRFWFGRKINFNISNLGAIDGLQAEKQWNHIVIGTFIGSRPDYLNYWVNPNLMQFGAYLTYLHQNNKGQLSSTIAIAEQKNHQATDRRFLYLQHQNSSIKNISIFTSAEIDLYTVKNNQPQSTLLLSSIYTSVRYRPSSKFSVFGSYDARKNIIYYETYKSFIDQLLEDELRQGLRFSFNYRPIKKVMIGVSTGYRFEHSNPHPTQNFNGYLTISQFSSLRLSATLSAILLQTTYLKGDIYGIRIAKDFMKGKLYEEVEYRTVVYRYGYTELPIKQQIIGLNTSVRLSKKLSLSINYEGEIQASRTLNRIYSNFVYRI
jgi:hypothetical protein